MKNIIRIIPAIAGVFILSSCSLLGLDQDKQDNTLTLAGLMAAASMNSSGTDCRADAPVGAEIDGPVRGVRVSWQALRESAVNRAGGGYKVCSSRTPCFDAAQANCVQVPFVAGEVVPTSLRVELKPGLHYVKVYGYSDMAVFGQASAEIKVEIP